MGLVPTEKVPVGLKSPRMLFIFSHTKTGKTSLMSMLRNNLIIDLEDGSEFVSGFKINVRAKAAETGKHPLTVLRELVDELKEKKSSGEMSFDYITLDTATGMEDLAVQLATIRYKQSNFNSKGEYTGNNVVMDLPKGAGYLHLRNAFEEIYSNFRGLYNKSLIITGHVKLSSYNKEGQELSVRDIDLTGKLKVMISQAADAIGFLYRSDEDPWTNILSFRTSSSDLATGARPAHLAGKDIIISKADPETRQISEAYWDRIFID